MVVQEAATKERAAAKQAEVEAQARMRRCEAQVRAWACPPPPAEPDRIDGSNQMMPGMLRMLLLMSLVMMTLCQMCAAGGDGAGPAAARARCGGAAGSLASDG
jgi:hypothetical protein